MVIINLVIVKFQNRYALSCLTLIFLKFILENHYYYKNNSLTDQLANYLDFMAKGFGSYHFDFITIRFKLLYYLQLSPRHYDFCLNELLIL